MKRFVIVIMLLSFVLSGCSILEGTPFEGTFLDNMLKRVSVSKKSSPDIIAKNFFQALKDQDYKKANKMMLEQYQGEKFEDALKQQKIDYKEIKIINNSEENGYKVFQLEIDGTVYNVGLKQEKEKWKIGFFSPDV